MTSKVYNGKPEIILNVFWLSLIPPLLTPSPLHEMLTPSPLHEMRSLGCCSPSYLASPMNACVPICAADHWASMLLKSFHAAS